jgi:homoserine O-acetyltransferase/O-succinyltransferase
MPRGGLGRPWGTDFPQVTIRDMVRAQKRLMDHLGIARWMAVIGGSMGGMQVLEWAATYPDAVLAAAPIACAAHHSAQNIAFHEVGPAGDPWRPGLAGRAVLGGWAHPRARPRGRADGRAHHLPVGTGADAEIRAAAARGVSPDLPGGRVRG